MTTTVTLDAKGDPNAVFIFQGDAAFNTAASSSVLLTNGAQAANVYWVVFGAAGTGAEQQLSGTILAVGAITLGAGTTLIGRALSRAAVTMAGNTVRFTDALPPTITIDGGVAATTKVATPTVTGTSDAPESSPVTVRVAGQILSTTVGSDTTWSVTAAALAAGRYDVVARVRDPAGNGSVVTQALTVELNPDPVDLGTAGSYAVLARGSVVNTGITVVDGDLGVTPGLSPGAVTGFPPGIVSGTQHVDDPAAISAQVDLLAAITDLSARTPHTEIVGDLGGKTFHLGVHHQLAALALTGTVTLDAEGPPGRHFHLPDRRRVQHRGEQQREPDQRRTGRQRLLGRRRCSRNGRRHLDGRHHPRHRRNHSRRQARYSLAGPSRAKPSRWQRAPSPRPFSPPSPARG